MPNWKDELPQITAQDRQEWRRWLEENHAFAKGVWLVYAKKASGKASIAYDEAVEEALCFGWIDSLVNPIDEQHYRQVFTPRKPGSGWSQLNKQRLEKLIAAGRMAAPGLEKIAAAQQDGSWSKLDAAENLEIPAELLAALQARPPAYENFIAFSSSARKAMLYWLQSAKRPATRAARLEEIVSAAAQNQKPKIFP